MNWFLYIGGFWFYWGILNSVIKHNEKVPEQWVVTFICSLLTWVWLMWKFVA